MVGEVGQARGHRLRRLGWFPMSRPVRHAARVAPALRAAGAFAPARVMRDKKRARGTFPRRTPRPWRGRVAPAASGCPMPVETPLALPRVSANRPGQRATGASAFRAGEAASARRGLSCPTACSTPLVRRPVPASPVLRARVGSRQASLVVMRPARRSVRHERMSPARQSKPPRLRSSNARHALSRSVCELRGRNFLYSRVRT